MSETLITDQRSAAASYKILRRLGKGGMAEVFLARQEGLAGFRRLAVIKKILPQFSQVSDVAEMLLDEARIAAQLTHPNIVQIFELAKDQEQYFIAMEYVDGCDLATLARIERHRQSRIPLRLVLRVVSEAAMGLDYAHRQTGLDGRPLNIVHRDMSPHNIMCSREGAVKVTDFGIAKAVGKALVTQVGVVKGKVQYMSPEQYTGGNVDHRSDIFSLGVVLYQLTSGKLPRVAQNGGVNMRRVIEGQIPRPSTIRHDYPEELEAIVMRALAHNPEERYPDAASLREDLLDFARENDLLAFPKELGDYVNAMVPPKAMVIREQSLIEVGGPPTPSQVHQTEASELPSVMVEGEEADTEAPSGTEVASPGAQRKHSVITDMRSDPFGLTEIPIESEISEQAVLTDEQFTPMPAALQEEIPTDKRPPKSEQPSRKGCPAPVPVNAPPTSTDVASSGRSTLRYVAGGGVVALGCAAALVYALYYHSADPDPPDPRPGPGITKPAAGAGVINVLANPSKAKVAIDGARRCPSTPCQIGGLPLGRELLLTIRSKGYNLWMQRLVLTPTEPKLLLRADLTPLSRTSVRTPDSAVPKDAAATGPAVKKPGGKRPAVKKPGGKRPAVKKPGGKRPGGKRPGGKQPQGKTTTTGKSVSKIVTIKIASDKAVMALDVRPWAEVWIDGKKIGHTPIQLVLPPGAHTVTLKNPEFKFTKTYKVRAKKGKKIKLTVSIKPPNQPGAPPK